MTLREVVSTYNEQTKHYRRIEGQKERRDDMNDEKMYLRGTHGCKVK
jgi:hypothetical protein